MQLPRRQFLNLAASAVAMPALLRSARADTYPSRPVHLLVGFPPGGAADIIARLTGQMLSERLGQHLRGREPRLRGASKSPPRPS